MGRATINGQPAPAGAQVDFLTPRGELAGCALVGANGAFRLAPAFGRDASGGISGFRPGETIVVRLSGCTALAARFWIDDHLPHEIPLAVIGSRCATSSPQSVYLPVIRK